MPKLLLVRRNAVDEQHIALLVERRSQTVNEGTLSLVVEYLFRKGHFD
jgi:hypothetical protein